MAFGPQTLLERSDVLKKHRGIVITVGVISFFAFLIVKTSPIMMDFLLSVNVAIALVVLVTVMYVRHPLEVSSFPQILVILTLIRLALNCSTTRLILGDANAGAVIEQFAAFVGGDNLVVGFVIFLILVIIQFIVITKGATRIAEVQARFALDGLPGKQMAIDADLNAGLINEAQARARRKNLERETDFYGAMDGASKFVRGDAIAGIIITAINLIGGFIVGMLMKNMNAMTSLDTYARLTIGDGLASQIPAFLVSVASAILITRSTSTGAMGEEVLDQLTGKSVALYVTGGFMFLLALTPMPKIPLAMIGIAVGGFALLKKRVDERAKVIHEEKVKKEEAAKPVEPEQVETLLHVDPMELEIGYGLVKLVDKEQNGDLLERISMIRRQCAQESGIVIPPIRIRDNMNLEPNDYVIKIKGEQVATGAALPDHLLAMDAGVATGKLDGIETREPAFGLPAYWIPESHSEKAQAMGYTVVEATAVIATHLSEIIKSHGDEILTRQEVNQLVEAVRKSSPALVKEVFEEGGMKPGDLQKILQHLLRERVSVRDLETIIEVAGDYFQRTKDPALIAEYVRSALARSISGKLKTEDGKLHVVTLDPTIENAINNSIEHSERGSYMTLSPGLIRVITEAVSREIERLLTSGHMPIVLVHPTIRMHVRNLLAPALPNITVLSHNEIPRDVPIESFGMVVLPEEFKNPQPQRGRA